MSLSIALSNFLRSAFWEFFSEPLVFLARFFADRVVFFVLPGHRGIAIAELARMRGIKPSRGRGIETPSAASPVTA